MLNVRLYFLQRLSALIMAPLVLGHLAVMMVAIQGGLDAGEILSRTQGSVWWGMFYGLFVLAVAVHGAIGLRVIVHEWLRVAGVTLEVFTVVVGIMLLGLGGRAVFAVVF